LYNSLKIKELELKVQWARGPNKRVTVGSNSLELIIITLDILKSMNPEKGML